MSFGEYYVIEDGYVSRGIGFKCFLPDNYTTIIEDSIQNNRPLEGYIIGIMYGSRKRVYQRVNCRVCNKEISSEDSVESEDYGTKRLVDAHKTCYEKFKENSK